MTTKASQITSLPVVNSTVYSDVDQRKHQSSASLAFVWGIHRDRWIPHTKGQLRGKCFHLMMSSWNIRIFSRKPLSRHVYVLWERLPQRCNSKTPVWGGLQLRQWNCLWEGKSMMTVLTLFFSSYVCSKFHETHFFCKAHDEVKHTYCLWLGPLTHWGGVTHICVSKLTIIGLDDGLPPSQRQAIIWTNNAILLIRTLRTHFSEIASEIHTFSFKKMRLKVSSAKRRPFCLGLNVLMY